VLLPVLSNGFIDYDTVFKLVVGKLKLPISSLGELTVREIGLLVEQNQEDLQDHYEMIALAFQLGYVNAKTKGKNKTLFNKKSSKSKASNKATSKEDLENEKTELLEMFKVQK